MDRKSVSAAVLIVAASVFYPRATSHGETSPQPNLEPAGSSTATQSGDGPWTPICDHFLRYPQAQKQPPSVKIDIEAKNSAKHVTLHANAAAVGGVPTPEEQYCVDKFLQPPEDATFRTMMVLAPDPELTQLSLDFDRTMESIVWAATDAGFSFEGYWFPWQTQPEKEETDPDKRKNVKNDQDERLNKPGMLLFRRNLSQSHELLSIFVVGDRPAFGPSRDQFQTAVDGIHTLRKGQPSEDIPIVGASFSGSIEPLRRLLASNPKDHFFIVTGRATDQAELQLFQKTLANAPDLCTTVENDDEAINGFTSYVTNWTPKFKGHAALLTEDETVYGARLGSKLDLGPDIAQFRFPRGISRLRNTVDELPGLNSEASRNTTGYQPLPLILKEPGEDTLRSFSQQLTPVSSEAVLLNIAVSLRRMKIQYAGILATDPLDMLFLARFLRIATPDIRLFLLESDALFAREAHNWNLEGMVTITNYPLVVEDQYGDDPPSKIAFASGYEEATYNACRRALSRVSQVDPSSGCDATSARHLPKNSLVGYQSPFPNGTAAHGVPALWLTVLGHNGFWPVALLDSPNSTLLQGPPPEDPCRPFDIGPEPFLWRALFLCLLAFDVAHLFFAFFNVPGIRNWNFLKHIRRYDLIRNFWIRPDGPYIGGQAASISIMLISLVLVNAMFLVPAMNYHPRVGRACLLFLIFFFLEALWMTGKAIIQCENWWGSPPLALLGLLFFAAVCFSLFLFLCDHSQTSYANFFFLYRSIHIDNGVSPVAPLLALAAGFYYWGWIQIRRYRMADEVEPEMPQTVIAPKNFMGEIHGVFGKQTSLPFGLITTIFFLIFCPFIYLHTVEGRAYDYLIAAALLCIYAMLIGSLVRFSILWRNLRIVLQFLERHPLREAFSRLPHTFSWTSIWNADLKPTYLTTTRSRDCLRRLKPYLDFPMEEDIAKIEDAQANNRFQFEPDYFTAWRRLECGFRHNADIIKGELQPDWIKGVSDSIADARKTSLDPERTKPPEGTIDKDLWFREEFLALQYVTLIRYVFFQMRNFLEFVTGGYILMVMAVYVYPFENHLLLGAANITMFGLLAAGMLIAFAQMDRDPVLSRLSATKPRLDMNFVWRVISYGSLPVLALLGSQFPTIGNFLFSWVQPALQSMK